MPRPRTTPMHHAARHAAQQTRRPAQPIARHVTQERARARAGRRARGAGADAAGHADGGGGQGDRGRGAAQGGRARRRRVQRGGLDGRRHHRRRHALGPEQSPPPAGPSNLCTARWWPRAWCGHGADAPGGSTRLAGSTQRLGLPPGQCAGARAGSRSCKARRRARQSPCGLGCGPAPMRALGAGDGIRPACGLVAWLGRQGGAWSGWWASMASCQAAGSRRLCWRRRKESAPDALRPAGQFCRCMRLLVWIPDG